ncbi:MAG: aldehyde dehydrogenase [Myxococcales bacterium]|nr:aldehyde dehydrogenase [Myxococcales bacterium]
MLKFYQKYTGSGGLLTSDNPSTGEPIGEVSLFTADDAKEAVARARAAQKDWAAKSLEERGNVLRRFQQVLLRRALPERRPLDPG